MTLKIRLQIESGFYFDFLLFLLLGTMMEARCSLWKGPHDKELIEASIPQPVMNWSPQSNKPQGTECCSEPCEWGQKQISLSWASRWHYGPDCHCDCSLMRNSEMEDAANLCLDFQTYRNWEIINICFFRLLHFGGNLLNSEAFQGLASVNGISCPILDNSLPSSLWEGVQLPYSSVHLHTM